MMNVQKEVGAVEKIITGSIQETIVALQIQMDQLPPSRDKDLAFTMLGSTLYYLRRGTASSSS
jgi:hypothetical protein